MKVDLSSKSITRFGLLTILLIYLFINVIVNYEFSAANMVIVLVSCIILVIKSKNEVGASVVFLFLLLSLLQISPEYLFNVRTTAYEFYYQDNIYNIVITILMIFTSLLAIFYNVRETKPITESFINKNRWAFLISFSLCLYILIFGVNRHSSTNYTVSIKTIYEYFVMTYCLAYYYSSKSKASNILMLFIGFCYIAQDFYYGGRISSVQLSFLIAILFFSKIKFKQIILLLIPAFISLKLVEIYRLNYSFSSLNFDTIFRSVFSNPLKEYQWNTFSEVLYSSSGLVYAGNHVYKLLDRVRSFFDFTINIFIGGVRPFGNIVSFISQNISKVGGGGFAPVYFYFWGGWVGTIFISVFVVMLLNFGVRRNAHDLGKIMYILILSTFPRWFYYSPLILFRYIIVNFLVLFFALKMVDILTKKNINENYLDVRSNE